jgi:predicted amidohydrolase YtcJ
MLPPESTPATTPLALAIVNARVWTRDERRTWADAVLTRGASIVAVGGSAELRKRAGAAASIIDAGGRVVVPLAANGRLAAGELADLAIVDHVADASARVVWDDADLLIVLQQGQVVVDHLTR